MILHWERRVLTLHHPFNTAWTRTSEGNLKEVLLVRIEHGGHTGWGEAAPVDYHGQSLESAEGTLAQVASMLGDDPFLLDRILDPIEEQFPDQPATLAAIDAALHDLTGKLAGLPTWRMLGLDPDNLPLSSFTIGIDDLETVAVKVREAADYPMLKVKVGTPDDDAVLSTVRREAPDKPIRVDANCAWNSKNVLRKTQALLDYGIEFVEQPTPRGDHAGLPALREALPVPLIADESCVSVDDVLTCVNVFDGINIKLCKCGGIRRGLRMIHIARAAGLRVMLGCMVETSVGIAAAAQLAPLADYIDLDGHLLLANDPFEGIGGAGGRLTLNNRPGLGVVER